MADDKLQRGERGGEVRGLRRSLNDLAITDERGQSLETKSGIYGQHTEAAVRKFQQANGLEPTGIADKATLEAIGKQLPQGKVTAEAEVTGPVQPPVKGPLITDPQHPNHSLYTTIGTQLPQGTDPKVVANVTLQAMENGITSEQKLERMAVSGTDAYLMGVIPGDRAKVDLNAPTPDLQAMSDHMREQTQQQAQPHRSQSQTMSI